MDTIPIISLICYSVPESFLIFIFGLLMIKEKIEVKKLVPAVVISVLLSFVVRKLPLPFGVHFAIGFIVILFLFATLMRVDIKKSLIATATSLGTMFALESTVLFSIQVIFDLSPEDMLHQSPWLRTIIGWPHLLVWALISFIIYRKAP